MTTGSFYSDTPNYATSYPTQNDTNTQPVNGNTTSPSSFYPNSGPYETLANADTLQAEIDADLAAAQAASAAAAASAGSMVPSSTLPLMDAGAGVIGTSSNYARADHVHPSDTSRAPLASPALTGVPTAPTAAASTNNTQLATTAYADGAVATLNSAVTTALLSKAPLASPALTGTPTVPTAAVNTNTTQAASTAFVLGQAASATPLVDGTAAVGTATKFAREDHVHPTDTTRAPLASPTFTGTPAAPTPTVGDNSTKLATTAFVQAALPLFKGYLWGLTLSTAGSSATFSVAAGVAVDSTNVDVMTLASALSKTTSAWAVGTGNGALDTGSIAASTWYHVWLIKRTDTGVVDVLISLSASAPTMPASYTEKRRIGSLLTNGSSQWTAFTQLGDEFLWKTPVNNANAVASSTTAANLTMTVPTGVQVWAKFTVQLNFVSAFTGSVFYAPDMGTQTDNTPIGFGNLYVNSSTVGASVVDFSAGIRTNTSGQVAYVSSSAGGQLFVNTYGWIDRRGRDL